MTKYIMIITDNVTETEYTVEIDAKDNIEALTQARKWVRKNLDVNKPHSIGIEESVSPFTYLCATGLAIGLTMLLLMVFKNLPDAMMVCEHNFSEDTCRYNLNH